MFPPSADIAWVTTKYEILDVAPDADPEEIRAAYRRVITRVHPDQGGSAALFRAVQDAYETLSDLERRAEYDFSIGILSEDPTDSDPRPGSDGLEQPSMRKAIWIAAPVVVLLLVGLAIVSVLPKTTTASTTATTTISTTVTSAAAAPATSSSCTAVDPWTLQSDLTAAQYSVTIEEFNPAAEQEAQTKVQNLEQQIAACS